MDLLVAPFFHWTLIASIEYSSAGVDEKVNRGGYVSPCRLYQLLNAKRFLSIEIA